MAAPLIAGCERKPVEIAISTPMDCLAAQGLVRQIALEIGFSSNEGEEIALVVAELTTNLIKHAGLGTLGARPIQNGHRVGIEIEASDHGPGINEVEKSFADGYSTTGSLGYGLGTVNRLMDEVDINSVADSGTQIFGRRWLKAAPQNDSRSAWEIGVFTRPRNGVKENGDAFVVKEWNRQLLIGLIDGLGHGELAQKAAIAAQQYVQSHYDLELDKIFDGVGRACRATRGVVMALARFETPGQISYASIGNIEVRARSGPERLPFSCKRGFLGAIQRNASVQHFPWNSEWMLVLHTDGVSTHWQWSDISGIERASPNLVAQELMRKQYGGRDDATVLAVRRREP
jgi:anti-sigma regulatory factor (Ser/Thr protein kinase)